MNIVILGTTWPFRGGLASFNERLAREFIAQGHKVTILTFTLQYPSFLFPGKTQYSDELCPTDLHIERAMSSINPFSWVKTARKIQGDVLVIKYWHSLMAPCLGTIARLAKRRTPNLQVVSILDNVIPHEPHFYDRGLTKYFIHSVDRFVAMSQSVADDCKRFSTPKQSIALCPHPLYDNFGEIVPKEVARQHLGLNPKTTYLLFFGFIRDYKGLDLLLQALSDTRLRNKDVQLLVAGEFYNGGEQYKRLEQQLHLEGKIVWHTDFIPNEDVRYYFSACDLVVQPYKSATQSGVTQVAYHFNRPMLVTAVGGLSEIVPNGKVGYVVPVDVKAIADALVDFCENGDHFQSGLIEEKKKYSWSKMTKAIIP